MAELDTNLEGATAAEVSLTDKSVVSLYVLPNTGTNNNHHVGLQCSPDGSNWVNIPNTLKGTGCKTYTLAAQKVRAIVTEPERSTSTVDVQIMAV